MCQAWSLIIYVYCSLCFLIHDHANEQGIFIAQINLGKLGLGEVIGFLSVKELGFQPKFDGFKSLLS